MLLNYFRTSETCECGCMFTILWRNGEKEVSAEAIDSEYFKKYLLAFSL